MLIVRQAHVAVTSLYTQPTVSKCAADVSHAALVKQPARYGETLHCSLSASDMKDSAQALERQTNVCLNTLTVSTALV